MLKRVLVASAAAVVVLAGAAAPASASVIKVCHTEGGSSACPLCVQNQYVDMCFL
jgi:hypothetical protein